MNIAEILRHCPKGTKLYSTVFGEVTLDEVDIYDIYPIVVRRFNYLKTSFDKEGHYLEDYPGAECVLFPSKEQRDWNKFRFPVKKGDIMMKCDGSYPFISNGVTTEEGGFEYICGTTGLSGSLQTVGNFSIWTDNFCIPASEEVKKRLFDKIEEAGYKWNANTLELEEAASKFKSKFKPFDKVLVKNQTDEKWSINLFSYYNKENKIFPYVCLDGKYHYCVPYEGNEYLVGKTAN